MAHKLRPWHIVLPLDQSDYFPILDKSQTAGIQSGLVTLMPGQNVGEHSTDAHEETIIILQGKGEVWVEECNRQSVEYGQVFYVPPHARHNVVNTGDVPLRYIFVVARIS